MAEHVFADLHRMWTVLDGESSNEVQELLGQAREILGMDAGLVSRVEDQDYVVVASSPLDIIPAGSRHPLSRTYCSITLGCDEVVAIESMSASPHAEHAALQDFGLECYIGVPLRLDGAVVGTLNFTARAPRDRPWTEEDKRLVAMFGRWMQRTLGRHRLLQRIEEVSEEAVRQAEARQRSEERLRRARSRLEAANVELQRFASVASHDLQHPLSQLQGFQAVLRDLLGDSASPMVSEVLGRMETSTRRMRNLVVELLEHTRSSEHPLQRTAVDMESLASELGELHRREGAARGVSVAIHALPPARADETLVRRLLHNLLSNAVTYVDADTAPQVVVRHRGGRYEVVDNGIGIAPENHEAVFRMFTRLHASKEFEGTGIGLASCRAIVERHGGEMGVDSAVGQGTTMWFTLGSEAA